MDGETTIAELQAVKGADLAYSWVLGQGRTLGDFQGEGECPTRKSLP